MTKLLAMSAAAVAMTISAPALAQMATSMPTTMPSTIMSYAPDPGALTMGGMPGHRVGNSRTNSTTHRIGGGTDSPGEADAMPKDPRDMFDDKIKQLSANPQ